MKHFLKPATLFVFVFTVQGCVKDNKKACRTCTARYNGSTIKSQEACSAQEEQDFKAQYYYAEVSCL